MVVNCVLLVEQLNVRKVVVGYDHRFGRNRTASLEDMYHYADIYDFEVIEIDAKKMPKWCEQLNQMAQQPRLSSTVPPPTHALSRHNRFNRHAMRKGQIVDAWLRIDLRTSCQNDGLP